MDMYDVALGVVLGLFIWTCVLPLCIYAVGKILELLTIPLVVLIGFPLFLINSGINRCKAHVMRMRERDDIDFSKHNRCAFCNQLFELSYKGEDRRNCSDECEEKTNNYEFKRAGIIFIILVILQLARLGY